MRVLVVVASKHGATLEIAEAIGKVLRAAGLETDVCDAEDAGDPAVYSAAVIGSAAYAGNWLKPARAFVDKNEQALAKMPVWLFSSGPLGNPLKPEDDEAVKISGIEKATGAVDHAIFPGALDKEKLGLAERAVIRAVRAQEGDYRDWEAIEDWAQEIAGCIKGEWPYRS
ncbi:MAG: flavodoxin domain-containing protein [Acidimicrobiia bacterium]|nr:flavodoxin domain-containing protein [Acidimicrobiia bacterium]